MYRSWKNVHGRRRPVSSWDQRTRRMSIAHGTHSTTGLVQERDSLRLDHDGLASREHTLIFAPEDVLMIKITFGIYGRDLDDLDGSTVREAYMRFDEVQRNLAGDIERKLFIYPFVNELQTSD